MFRQPSQVETSAGSISVSMAEGGGVRKGLGWGEEGVAQMTRRHGGARVREHERLALGNCQVHFFFFFPKAVQNFSILFFTCIFGNEKSSRDDPGASILLLSHMVPKQMSVLFRPKFRKT